MERLFASYVARRASRIMGRAARIHVPSTFLKPMIRLYSIGFGVSTGEVEEPVGGFKSFSDFFGRRLRPEARPVCRDRGAVVSPCDGEVVDFGELDTDGNPTFFVKGSRYDLDGLLGSESAGRPFGSGGYLIVYLHPRDYHRVHMPMDAEIYRVRRVPGKCYPVNGWLDDRVKGIYGKNERVVFHFRCSGGQLAIVMVGAFGVGNIETRFATGSDISPDVCRERDFSPPIAIARQEELGAFLLGSTVLMVWSKGVLEMDEDLLRGPVVMGRRIGGINRESL
jgi:phosphatidylserine decarboxylase